MTKKMLQHRVANQFLDARKLLLPTSEVALGLWPCLGKPDEIPAAGRSANPSRCGLQLVEKPLKSLRT